MERKLRIFFSLLLFGGASLLAQQAATAQTTADIDEVKNPCGTQKNGSFRITVTAGLGPFSVNVFNASTGEFASFPVTLNVPEIIGLPPQGLSAGNIVISVVDTDPAPNYTDNLVLVAVPEITGINTTDVHNSDNTCLNPNGSITINTINGGSGSFDFSWTGPNGFTATTQNIFDLAGGDYVVTVTDKNANCSFTTSTITLTDPAPSAFTISSPDLTPCANADFTVDLSLAEPGVQYTLFVDGNPTATSVIGPTNSLVHSGGLPAGAHTITVQAMLGSCAPRLSSNSLNFDMNAGPTSAVLSGNGVICAGESADLAVTITGGTGPYSFVLDNGIGAINNYVSGTAIPVSPAADATYSIVGNVTDANGCFVAGSGSASVTVNPPPTAVISGGGDYCAGGTLPTVTFTFTGTGPFDFTYNNGGPPVSVTGHGTPTFDIPNAPVGTYTITALSDNNGCVAVDLGTPVDVTENPLPTASASGGGTVCAGTTLPDVTFTFTGTGPFDFTYTDGVTPVVVTGHPDPTYTIPNAPQGSYTVTALTDANGCAATDLGTSADVIIDPLPTAAISGGGDYCVGSAAPTVTFTFTGEIPFDFTYTVDGAPINITGYNALTFDLPTAAAGTYAITDLSDNNGCVAIALGTPVTVTEHPLPTAITGGGGEVCADAVLPNVTFTFTGTAPFDFTYTDGTTPVSITGHNDPTYTVMNAPAGTYSVTALSDANGCVATSLGGTASVVVDPLPVASLSGGGSVCVGSPRPDITITFTGKAPFDFTYTNGVTPVTINNHNFPTFTITNPVAGTYEVTALTDDNGCTATDLGLPVQVIQNPLPTAVSGGGGTACAGGVLPDVTFTFTGTAPFDFTYTDGTTPVTVNGHGTATYTIPNAPAGNYSVTSLTDANGCAATSLGGSTVVIVDPLPTATISGGGSVCAGSPLPSVTFTFTGAIPFDFTYSDGVNTVSLVNNSFTYTITNAAPGTYSIIELTDDNGCLATALGTPVEVKEDPLPTAVVSGGGAVCDGTDLPTVTFTFTGTAPFDFTYTDGGTNVDITDHPTNTFVIDDAVAGSYSVTALADANGCVATNLGGSVDVIVHALPTATVGGGGNYCEGSTLPTVTFTFTGAPPFDFTYTDGTSAIAVNGHNGLTFDIVNAPEGDYEITALTDNNGCNATSLGTPVTVTENPLPTAVTTGGGAICDGALLPDVTFTFTGAAPFDFTYTDGVTPVTINGHNALTYTITEAPAGSYSVTALSDQSGCVGTSLGGAVDVIVNPLPTASISGGGSYCEGSAAPTITFTFTGSIPIDFTYTDGVTPVTVTGHNALTFDIINPGEGTYAVTALSDNNGCAATSLGVPVPVVEHALPTASTAGGGTVCSDSALPDVVFTFTGTPPFDFTYSDGTTSTVVNGHGTNMYTVTGATAGTWSVTALTDAIGCAAVDLGSSVAVIVEPAATATAGSAQMICIGGNANLTGSSIGGSATTGTWSILSQPPGGDGALSDENPTANPAGVSFTATIAGDYILRLTTDEPTGVCAAATDDVIITVSAGAIVDAGPVQTICESGTAQLAASFSGATGITWSTLGDGSFDDVTKVDAIYTPGPTDITNQTVTLVVTTGGPCAPVVDDVVITIDDNPIVEAGVPQTICSAASIVLNGSFGGSATGLQWTTSGDGNFDDATDPNASYAPGPADAANGSVVLTATATGSCPGFIDNVTITINQAATVDAGSPQTVCIGNTVSLGATIGGSATSMTWTTSGDGTFDLATNPNAIYTPGANDIANGMVTLTATTNNPPGPCPAVNDQMVITFSTIPGDQTTPGNETWIGYVYDDSGDAALYPAKADFNTTKYRGFITEADLANMSTASTYDPASDKFDLDLGTDPLYGPTVCGTYTGNFSVRYKMNKTFAEGVYRFTVGADDGVMLLIDGVAATPGTAFDLQSYTTYTTSPVCLSAGVHTFEIRYFENLGDARLTFDYEAVPAVATNDPVQVCVGSAFPTLTASSTDADVVDFNWYLDGVLVFTGANYTPTAAELDMNTEGTTVFSVRAAYACGEAPGTDVNVEVLDGATLVIAPQTICESGGSVDLRDFVTESPAGGAFIFAGHPGITGDMFDPSGVSGTVFITVDYSTGSCTAPQGTLELTVTNTASITVPAAAVPACESSADIDLTTLVSASPAGGAFTFGGPGVTGNTFDPSGSAGLRTITVDYIIGACVASQATFDIDVTSSASVVTANTNACADGSPVNLMALVTPTPPGGNFTFTGSGVSGSLFNPVGQTGVVNINVDYDFNGCTDNGTIQVTILSPTDPLCTSGNCASVVIAPQVSPATCTNSDGRMVMSITPWTPVINNTGIKITIDGISSTGLHITRTNINDPVFENLPVGDYDYTIEYGDPSCVKTGVFSIDQSGTVGPAVASDIVAPSCFGTPTGSITLDVPGETGNILEWSLDGGLTDPFKPFTAGSQITGIPAGPAPTFQQVISVRRTIADVCYSSVTFTMAETVSAIAATFNVTPATCNGNDGAITGIAATGGHGAPYTFSVDGKLTFQSLPEFNNLVGGTFTLWVRDATGCEKDFQAVVTSPGFVNFDFDKDDANCVTNTGSITVTALDPGQFKVALGTSQLEEPAEAEYQPLNIGSPYLFDKLSGGQYFVFVKSVAAGCATRKGPVTVLDYNPINFDVEPLCNGTDLSIRLTNVTGQASPPNMEIQIFRRPDLNNKIEPAVPPVPYPVSGEIFLAYNDHDFLKVPGEYQVSIRQVQILGGVEVCEILSPRKDFIVPVPVSAQVIPLDPAVASSYPDVPSGKLKVGNISGGAVPYEVRIQLDSASSFAMPIYDTEFAEATLNSDQRFEMFYQDIPPGRYFIEVADAMGCTAELVGRVPLDRELFIPNVFTPNGDGANEVFFIRNLPLEQGDNKLTITNRWGTKIYASENYQNNWDGADAADGIYFYHLKTGAGDTRTGWVEIIRGPKP